jgi:hypothetical protein
MTFTISETETYSEADVKTVMRNTYEDIIGFANRGIITYTRAKSWIEDLIFILNKQSLKFFEIRLYTSAGVWIETYRYDVSSGYFVTGSSSGGIDYFKYANGTIAGMYAELDFSNKNAKEVDRILREERGWGTGSATSGSAEKERSYVSGSLAINRSIIK